MKNLLIYISPTGSFDNPRSDLASNDAGILSKVQIDNGIDLGWQIEDFVLITNFEYSYRGVKPIILDVDFFDRKPQVSKINAIIRMFEEDLVGDDMYWFHDWDAFQLVPIDEEEIGIADDEIAVTEYGGLMFAGMRRISTGVIYFKKGSRDIFERMKKLCYEKRIDEEEALCLMVLEDENIKKRVKILNYSYNFIGYSLRRCYKEAIKPLKVVHFHPLTGKRKLGTDNSLRFFKGDNHIQTQLITDRVVDILKDNGIV